MATIKNITTQSNTSCNCGSWLKHWENYSGNKAKRCAVNGCFNSSNLVGAFVDITTNNAVCHYIVPLCAHHSLDAENLEVGASTLFVSANKNKTCEILSHHKTNDNLIFK